jgi:hypothetical protein
MGIFNEWLEKRNITEGIPVGWSPSPSIGGNPLRSALEKMVRGLSSGQLDHGYVDGGAVKLSFGLDDRELQYLKNLKLIVPSQESGVEIDRTKLTSYYDQIRNGSSGKPQMAPKAAPNNSSWDTNPFGKM